MVGASPSPGPIFREGGHSIYPVCTQYGHKPATGKKPGPPDFEVVQTHPPRPGYQVSIGFVQGEGRVGGPDPPV